LHIDAPLVDPFGAQTAIARVVMVIGFLLEFKEQSAPVAMNVKSQNVDFH